MYDMKSRKVICVLCPRGCTVLTDLNDDGQATVLEVLSGQPCPKGIEYVNEELLAPMRTVTTTMEVRGGRTPLVSVRTTGPVPLEQARKLVQELSARSAVTPIEIGQVLVPDVLGLGVDIIATRSVDRDS
mgnify:CR=1 FL=1